jgi:hypothetical protein
MATSAILRFYADADAHVPGSIQSGQQAELFATIRDFFQFTNVWQEDLSVTVSASSLVYTLTVSSRKAINRLMNLYASGDVDKRWVWPATMQTPGTLMLSQALSGAGTRAWVATVSLYSVDPVDSDGNAVFPSWILDKYFDVLFSGMISRMMSQPSKPWSNTQLAVFHGRKYLAGRARCRSEVERMNTFNAQAWQYPQAAVSSNRQRGV